MRIDFYQKVVCLGGEEAGEVSGFVIDRQSNEVTDVALSGSRLVGDGWYVPLSMVQGTTDQGILLYCSAQQLNLLPQPGVTVERPASSERAVGEAVTPEPAGNSKAMTVRHDAVVLTDDCLVVGLDGQLGDLAGVMLDLYTNHVSSVVVRAGISFKNEAEIPSNWIDQIGPNEVRIAATIRQAQDIVGPQAGPYIHVEAQQPQSKSGYPDTQEDDNE